MVNFVGAGSGAVDLITVRGLKLVQEADVIIYAGSLVNPEILQECKAGCEIYNSAKMTLEEVIGKMETAEAEGKKIVRLHTGDPCLYGAIREQMDILEEKNIQYAVCPGVSSFCGAAAALQLEYTLPNVSQSVVITRVAGRTKVPEMESIRKWAVHKATMVIFLSIGLLKQVEEELIAGGYDKNTPAAIVYKATWPEEKLFYCTVSTLAETAEQNQITKTGLVVVGDVLNGQYERSKLYDPAFTTGFRTGRNSTEE
ncbi:MAG: precorrin-4 C(11)-methyltransferase [Lachnospiraceae bacterium]|nr:precorrin-4 C(11)-methyltransferase [Lachnospiraceae bacterium]